MHSNSQILTDTIPLDTHGFSDNQGLIGIILIIVCLFIFIIIANKTILKGKKRNKYHEPLQPSDIIKPPEEQPYNRNKVTEDNKTEDHSPSDSQTGSSLINQKTTKQHLNDGKSIENSNTTKTDLPKPTEKPKVKVNPETTFVKAEEEKRSQIKFIGYEPNDLFHQKEPLNYPYVIMPKTRSVIKFPRKNKVGTKGFTEEHFLNAIEYYFEKYFCIYNDRILIISSKQNPYEPDITLIDEFTELNLFIDIEIDEPYDGITREPMHFKNYDNERNRFFANRGWLTIRFAEEQVWNYPQSCCKFIFKVIYSLSDHYAMPYELDVEEDIKFIPQWTFDQARYWSEIKYREQYLDNDNFRKQMINKERGNILDSELENKIEEYVDKQEISSKVKSQNIKETIVKQAINTGKYISCKFNEDPTYTILKPQSLNGNFFSCYCYLKNKIREFNIDYLTNPIIRDQPSLIKHNNEIGVDEIKRVVKDAIQNNKKIRMKYTRGEWTERFIDEETGEIIENRTESEQSLRTISNIDYAVNDLDERRIEDYNLNSEDYISAYCHKREAQRIFRFDRIDELEILNI